LEHRSHIYIWSLDLGVSFEEQIITNVSFENTDMNVPFEILITKYLLKYR